MRHLYDLCLGTHISFSEILRSFPSCCKHQCKVERHLAPSSKVPYSGWHSNSSPEFLKVVSGSPVLYQPLRHCPVTRWERRNGWSSHTLPFLWPKKTNPTNWNNKHLERKKKENNKNPNNKPQQTTMQLFKNGRINFGEQQQAMATEHNTWRKPTDQRGPCACHKRRICGGHICSCISDGTQWTILTWDIEFLFELLTRLASALFCVLRFCDV